MIMIEPFNTVCLFKLENTSVIVILQAIANVKSKKRKVSVNFFLFEEVVIKVIAQLENYQQLQENVDQCCGLMLLMLHQKAGVC